MNNNTAARAAAAAASRATAAVFVDYGNLFSYLKNSQNESSLVPDSISDIIRGVERQLDRKLNQNAIALKAYADFEELRNGIQSTLYEMGVETRNVAATGLNDSADLQLSIDALDLLYTRPDITTFVIVCADRDYIPLVQHIKRQGRTVILATLRTCISPDMLQFIGPSHYIDVAVAADPNAQRQLEQSARGNGARGKQRHAEVPGTEREWWDNGMEASDGMTGSFAEATELTNHEEQVCVDVLLKNYGHHAEVWISPFLRKLSDALPHLHDFERKAMLNTLEDAGAIRIEKRHGEPHDYSIILINRHHPNIRGFYEESTGEMEQQDEMFEIEEIDHYEVEEESDVEAETEATEE
ncbi:MAG: NYN domain-containing protein [Chlorobi bacterium]|nr:MAG: NYN domain protein [Chlorobi bacterium OLB7]MBK8912006.1 NYN domain-containing protein [Chlorobiota bacterium]MBX7215356.1 NYN domain-containing protein [Candidatus Kapabacteria bacterium]